MAAEADLLIDDVQGDVPARCRLEVYEQSSQYQMAVIWALRQRYYSAALTNHWEYEAQELTRVSGVFSAPFGVPPQMSTSVLNISAVGSVWTSVLSTDHATAGALTHRGTHRVWARVLGNGSAVGDIRLIWDVGDLTNPSENTPAPLPNSDGFYLVDLGEVRLDALPVGVHRWRGVVQVRGTSAATASAYIDKLYVLPVDEGYGVLRALPRLATSGVEPLTASDPFNQAAGALNGKALAGSGASQVKSAGSATDDATVGNRAWATPTNVTSSNGAYATADMLSGETTHRLKVHTFGVAIPAGSTVNGIKVEIERHADFDGGNPIKDLEVRLLKAGSPVGTDKAATGVAWPTADAYAEYGGPGDLWGTTWSEAEVEVSSSSGFGVAIRASGDATRARKAFIDHVRITVYYTSSGGELWAATGDADDFTVETTGKTAQRTAVSDVDLQTGRYAIAGTGVQTKSAVQIDAKSSVSLGSQRQGVVARYVDVNNHLFGGVEHDGTNLIAKVATRLGGSLTTRKSVTLGPTLAAARLSTGLTVALAVSERGVYMLWVYAAGSERPADPTLVGYYGELDVAGQLDDGAVGFYDAQTSATASTRNYDNFASWSPAFDAVLNPGMSISIRHNGASRLDPAGVGNGVVVPEGDNPRLPPAGLEDRSSQLIVIASRGDLDQVPDGPADIVDVRAFYNPCYLFPR